MHRVVLALLAAVLGACTGTIEVSGSGPGSDATGGAADGSPDPVDHVVIEGPPVLPHVQAFADAACAATGACQPSTYEGHHPSADRAIDTLMSEEYGTLPADDNALGDAHAEFALSHMAEFGIWYVIWRQRYNDGSGWDPMEDRGSITQNHYDHVHVSFNETAP
jgi:hypothetical protein